jgi:hypothetical protein
MRRADALDHPSTARGDRVVDQGNAGDKPLEYVEPTQRVDLNADQLLGAELGRYSAWRSINATAWPARPSSTAASVPLNPAPTTMTSNARTNGPLRRECGAAYLGREKPAVRKRKGEGWRIQGMLYPCASPEAQPARSGRACPALAGVLWPALWFRQRSAR